MSREIDVAVVVIVVNVVVVVLRVPPKKKKKRPSRSPGAYSVIAVVN